MALTVTDRRTAYAHKPRGGGAERPRFSRRPAAAGDATVFAAGSGRYLFTSALAAAP